MKRILYLSYLDPNKCGSIQDQALLLCKELTRRGHKFFFAFIAEPTSRVKECFKASAAPIFTIKYFGNAFHRDLISKIREIYTLRRVITENRIDLVHVNFAGLADPAIFGIYPTKAKIIYTEHSSGLPFHRGLLKLAISRLIHSLISRRVSIYIGVSNYVSCRLRETHHVHGNRVKTQYNGVDTQRFQPRSASSAREQLGLPLEKKIICSVSMLIPEKGIQHLLHAAALLVNEHQIEDILFVIVGEGYYREELEKRLTNELRLRDHVLFLGRRNDVHTIVAAADIVVVPSVWDEAFGLIIAEAMASSRPVVASDVGAIPELIDDGLSGLLVEPGDSSALSRAILRLISDDEARLQMGRAGRVKSIREFDLSRQVGKLADLYEAL
jgi:L-malate glycosyltransferase